MILLQRRSFLLFFLLSVVCSKIRALEQPAKNYVGAWKITEAMYPAGNLVELNSGGQLTLSPKTDSPGDSYRVDINISNHFTTTMKILGETDEGYSVESGHPASTRMMAPPPLRELETFIATTLEQFDTIKSENDVLELSGNGAKLLCIKLEGVEGSS